MKIISFLRRNLVSSVSLALSLTIVLTSLVFADNVQNDVVAGGNDTFILGGSTTVSYKITANSGDGETGCNATVASPATVTFNASLGVTATPSSLTFTSCGANQPIVFTATTVGERVITVSVTDSGEGTYNTNPAKFTLKVLTPPTDTTPPVITLNVNEISESNGWYVSDVTVSWSVVDGESAISSSSGCGSTTINYDTAGVTLTCSATSAGGTSSQSVTIKRDATAPSVSASPSPAPNGAGWNNTDVTVSFSGSDALSGISSCDAPVVLSSEGAGQSASGSCTDVAGNSASATKDGINIDKTSPTITWSSQFGASYYFGFVPEAPTCTASDDLSGPNGCNVEGYETTVGTHTLTATAYDVAGNMTVENRAYTVTGWEKSGFYSPVDMGGVLNVVKAGSTVPLKFEIFAGATELTEVSRIKTPITATKVTCDTSAPQDTIETSSAGATELRYDPTSGQFIYNWKVPKVPAGSCYKVTVNFMDGGYIEALFKVK